MTDTFEIPLGEDTYTVGEAATQITLRRGPVSFTSGGGAVDSVNGQTGVVVLGAADVGALGATAGAGGGLSGNYPNPGLNDEAVQDLVGAMVNGNTETGAALTYDDTNGKLDIAVAYGTSAGTSAQGNDSRLSDARTPTSHASSHASDGSDPLTLAQSQITGLTSDLALKAPLASPTLTGVPTAPTAPPGTDSTQIATTAFVLANAPQGPTGPAGPAGPAGPTGPQGPAGPAGVTYTELTTAVDAKVADAINDGVTTVAPSQNAVYDGLALKQPLDADLTAIAALAPSDDALIQRKAGAWTSRTPAQVKADMSIGVGDVSGFDEQVRDVVGTALVAGSNVTITVNDGSDTITIASTGGGGGSSDPSVVVLGPALLTSAFGTPVTGDTIGERMAAWVIADATTVMLGADLASHVPSSWRAFDVHLRAFQVTSISTPANIATSFSSAQITDASIAAGTAVPVESGTFTWDEGVHANQFCPILAQNVPCEWKIGTAVAVLPIPGSSQPVRFRFPRALAGDTLNAGTFGVFGVVLRQVDGTDDPTATTELAPVVAALDAATTDQSILVISDSTAEWDAPARDWPRRLARRINRAWPAWSTRARLYNETSHAWDSYMTPAGSIAGTSARMFTVHNAAVGGWATTNWTSELSTMATGVTPNAIFIALGFNDSATAGTFNTNMTALVNAVQAQWPGVPLVLIAQPKDQGGSGQTTRRTEIISIATAEDIGWIDVWTEFTPYSTTTGHYSDNQHQTQLGSEVIAGRVFGAFCG